MKAQAPIYSVSGRSFILLMTVCTGLVVSSLGGPIQITFDDRPGMTGAVPRTPVPLVSFVSTQYLSLGVVFGSGGGGIAIVQAGNSLSPPNVANGTDFSPLLLGPVDSYTTPVSATFSISGAPAIVDSVSLGLTSTTSTSLLSAYDPNGTLLGSTSGGASSPLSVSFPGEIHSVILSGGPFAFDNFTFDGLTVVPEPSVFALVALGIIALFAFPRWLERTDHRPGDGCPC